MNLKQQLILGPLEKYQQFGKPPYKAVLTVVLVFLSTFQLLSVVHQNIYCNSSQRKAFVALYFDPAIYEQEIFQQSQYFHIRQATELQKHLLYMMNTLNNLSLTVFQNISIDNAKMTLVKSDVYYSREPTEIVTDYPIDMKEGIVSPFQLSNLTSIKEFLMTTARFEIHLEELALEVSGIRTKWSHVISYEFVNRGEIDISIHMHPGTIGKLAIQDQRGSYFKLLTIFYVVVVLVALWSLLLNYRYFRRMVNGLNQYNRTISLEGCNQDRRALTPKYMFQTTLEWAVVNRIPLRALSWGEMLEIIDIWVLVGSLGNLCQVVGSIFLLSTQRPTIIIGLGCITAWIVLFKFLRRYQKMVLLNKVLSMSLPQIFIFMGEFIPAFLAFTIFGSTVFWKVELFSTVRKTIATQMCLLVGDSIDMITLQIAKHYGSMMAIFYVFGFVLLFMQAIHNMLTGLIKEKFLMYKVEISKKELKKQGLEHMRSIIELRTPAEQERDKLPIAYSVLFQSQLERKKRKKLFEELMGRIQMTFEIVDQELLKVTTDFEHDARYYHLEESEFVMAREQLKKILKTADNRIQVICSKTT